MARTRYTPSEMIAALSLAFIGSGPNPPQPFAVDPETGKGLYKFVDNTKRSRGCAISSLAVVNPALLDQLHRINAHQGTTITQRRDGVRLTDLVNVTNGDVDYNTWCTEDHQLSFLQALQDAHDHAGRIDWILMNHPTRLADDIPAIARAIFAQNLADVVTKFQLRQSYIDAATQRLISEATAAV
jgi:hypothetical protein